MTIQQYIYNNTGVLLPISGGNGQSLEHAVVIGSEAKYALHKEVKIMRMVRCINKKGFN
jgi:hypothetical protein